MAFIAVNSDAIQTKTPAASISKGLIRNEKSVPELLESLMLQEEHHHREVMAALQLIERHGWIDEFRRTLSRVWAYVKGYR